MLDPLTKYLFNPQLRDTTVVYLDCLCFCFRYIININNLISDALLFSIIAKCMDINSLTSRPLDYIALGRLNAF